MPLERVKQELGRYCSTPWDQVSHIHLISCLIYVPLPECCTFMILLFEQIVQQHPGVKLKYLAVYCFSGTYILTLLTEGYNFTSESYANIKYIKKVGKPGQVMPLPGCPLSSALPWPFVQTSCWMTTQASMSHFKTLILIALMVALKDYTGLVNWEEQTELGMA